MASNVSNKIVLSDIWNTLAAMAENNENPHPSASNRALPNEGEAHGRSHSSPLALPSDVAGSGTLDRLINTARDYAKGSTAENTNKAYAADWKHFARWCRLKGTPPCPPHPR